MTRTWTVARQVAFFRPADDRGKWHAARKVTHTAACGAAVTLSETDAISTEQGQDSSKVHPLVCRRCLYLATSIGYTASGYKT